jgi:RNA polymerase sigma-70 factor (ECF subfamily)
MSELPKSVGSADFSLRSESHGLAVFQTTSWGIVLAASETESSEGVAALERLCGIYWAPLYSYLRRKGQDPEAAQDLTQQFFLKLLQRDTIKRADQSRGRFRTFLLASLQNFLVDEWKAAQAVKRGAGRLPISLDGLEEHERMALEPADTDTPAQAFERRWAQVVLDEAARRHQQEHARSGQLAIYDRLRALHSTFEDAPFYSTIAAEMGVPVGTLKSQVSRFRSRYRQHIRSVIAETVASPDEIEDEIRHLLQLFSR